MKMLRLTFFFALLPFFFYSQESFAGRNLDEKIKTARGRIWSLWNHPGRHWNKFKASRMGQRAQGFYKKGQEGIFAQWKRIDDHLSKRVGSHYRYARDLLGEHKEEVKENFFQAAESGKEKIWRRRVQPAGNLFGKGLVRIADHSREFAKNIWKEFKELGRDAWDIARGQNAQST